MKRFICIILAVAIVLSIGTIATASNENFSFSLSAANGKLTDRAHTTYESLEKIMVSATGSIKSLYIVFWDTPTAFSVNGKPYEAAYLHQLVEVNEGEQIEITFNSKTKVSDIFAFGENLPDWVQKWTEPVEKADILLCPTHSDDDQLYFAGLLPYYAGEKGYSVQVAYLVDHSLNPQRRHELLNGLWEAGVTAYPVINPIADLYSESAEEAIAKLEPYGVSEDDILDFQITLLRRFKPQVVVTHDFGGEYGHGMHKLNAKTMARAIELSGDATASPQSAEQYGVWSVKKMYVHLYEENQVVLDLDTPLSRFGGKTAYEVSCAAFEHHKSQHSYSFLSWLRGKNNEYTKATQITKYSPTQYGLYYTAVGEDKLKNDLFENLTDYKTIAAKEKETAEAEEKARLEAEEKERLEIALQKQKEKNKIIRIVSAVVLVAVGAFLLIRLVVKKNKKKK